MKQKIRRSEQIPKYGTPLRSRLIPMVVFLPGYLDGMRKGFPLFTKEELDQIQKDHKDGIIWEDIDRILSGKGIFFKKATFRKYIQEGNLSKAIGYRNTKVGRVAEFPADTISHINFIQYYYKVLDGEAIDNIIDIIKDHQITYLEAIESHIARDNFYASSLHYVCFDDAEAYGGIEEALQSRPAERDKFLKMLDDIQDKFEKVIRADIDELVSLLKKKNISVFETVMDKPESVDPIINGKE